MLPVTHDTEFREEALAAVRRVAEGGRFVLGPEVEAFEAELAAFCGARHAIGVSSGTDALLACLMAAGVGPGDEVVVPSFSFAASATCVPRVGATPAFLLGIDPATFCAPPSAFRGPWTARTRAVVAVHLFGACCDLSEATLSSGCVLIEDAAQALGAERDGRPAGTTGLAGCFSFFPTKNLGAWGDAGAIITNDDGFADDLRAIRNHGGVRAYEHGRIGGNFRLDEIQAAVLRVALRRLPGWNDGRRRVARLYDEALTDVQPVQRPRQHAGSTWHQYVVRVPAARRDEALAALAQAGIAARVYYPKPLYEQPCFGRQCVVGPEARDAEILCRQVIGLPIHPWVDARQIDQAAAVLRRALT